MTGRDEGRIQLGEEQRARKRKQGNDEPAGSHHFLISLWASFPHSPILPAPHSPIPPAPHSDNPGPLGSLLRLSISSPLALWGLPACWHNRSCLARYGTCCVCQPWSCRLWEAAEVSGPKGLAVGGSYARADLIDAVANEAKTETESPHILKQLTGGTTF